MYLGVMALDLDPVLEQLRVLVDEVRSTCLWYIREDYYPKTVDEALAVLDAIERHGDLAAFRRAAEIRAWLSHPSSAPSVDA